MKITEDRCEFENRIAIISTRLLQTNLILLDRSSNCVDARTFDEASFGNFVSGMEFGINRKTVLLYS